MGIPLIRGEKLLPQVTEQILDAAKEGELTIGADLDGTLVHAEPGVHDNVPHDPALEKLLNRLNFQLNGNVVVITGRPYEFVRNIFPSRNFLVGTEHGAVISRHHGEAPEARIGNPEHVQSFRSALQSELANDDRLTDVQIEDYKEASASINFTHVFNPEHTRDITAEQVQKMQELTAVLVDLSTSIVNDLDSSSLQVLDTVTPTNAIIEIIPEGACKAESLQYMRDSGLLSNTALTVFKGDSGGDQTVMEKVCDEGGIPLGVGPKAPECSKIVFERPEGLRKYFADIADALNDFRNAPSDQPAAATSRISQGPMPQR